MVNVLSIRKEREACRKAVARREKKNLSNVGLLTKGKMSIVEYCGSVMS